MVTVTVVAGDRAARASVAAGWQRLKFRALLMHNTSCRLYKYQMHGKWSCTTCTLRKHPDYSLVARVLARRLVPAERDTRRCRHVTTKPVSHDRRAVLEHFDALALGKRRFLVGTRQARRHERQAFGNQQGPTTIHSQHTKLLLERIDVFLKL